MKKVVLDTDVIIDLLRINKGLLLPLLELQEQGKLEIYISSVTIMELFAGEMKSAQMKMLSGLLAHFKSIPFDDTVARFSGELKRGKKLQIHLSDFIIGVTAVYFEAQLATRNKDHFKGISKIHFYSP